MKDVAPLQRGFDLPKSEISEGPYPVLFSNGIGGWHSEYKAKAPGVITGRSGSIGNVVFIEQNYWPHNTSLWVTNFFDNCPRYVYYLYHHVDLSKFGTGSGVPTLNRNDVHDYSVIIPKPEEQSRIATFFKKLDDTIALHQRKLTLLKQLKQTYLKQIFPQNKENMPALRFAGFSEPWKQSKFDEVFSHVQNNSLSRADLNYKSGYAMNIHYGDILIRFGEYLDVSKYQLPMIANKQLVEKYKSSILKDGDIVIADAAENETVGKCSELGGIEDANILAGLHTIPSRPNWTFASGYLGYYMNSSAFHDQLLPLIQGTKISSISKSALKKTDIKYPHGKDEQTKIGNLFKQLDDSIALHQSKLEKLMDLKQVLLAKMFV
ncbi:type I restriction enzyme, S subunit [Trichococcus ilyis]|uniref:Restriction endonuclease type i hsds n=1 Tax=Trichococcus ilyis TaxID=640938 RepID=A0A143YN05_9LACT|nr:restriction endonuclease type i hsds [Trichococcus ilyis]SEI74343.1 type I restriction enzyme, S subunit [Trichococcus ilyis]